MDRRLFVTGLLGVVGTTGIATVLPRQAQALAAVPLGGPAPQSDSSSQTSRIWRAVRGSG